MALSRLGVENMIDLLLKKAVDSYPWIQARVRRYLEECLRYTASKRKREELRQAMKKLAVGSKGFSTNVIALFLYNSPYQNLIPCTLPAAARD